VHHYRILNVIITSPFPLSQAQLCPKCIPDVHISFVDNTPPECDFGPDYYSKVLGDRVLFYWPDEACYIVQQGRSVEIFLTGPFNPKLVELSILGPILSTILHQRKKIPFHGCAVVKNGKANVFMGDQGMGKSTIAGYLVAKGYGYLSDDVLLLQPTPEGWETLPCYPSMKLQKKWVDRHGFSAQPMSDIDPQMRKWQVDMKEHYVTQPCAIKHITILRPAKRFKPIQLSPSEAYIELLKTTHTAKWLEGTPQAISHMEQCREIIKNVPVNLIEYPHRAKALEQLSAWLDTL
jgi:hypothetical protein